MKSHDVIKELCHWMIKQLFQNTRECCDQWLYSYNTLQARTGNVILDDMLLSRIASGLCLMLKPHNKIGCKYCKVPSSKYT